MTHQGLPVKGYQQQTVSAVETVNKHKQYEELLLRAMDRLKESDDVDQRWLAVARTQMEQAFMPLNRSVFKPGRAELDPVFIDVQERIQSATD